MQSRQVINPTILIITLSVNVLIQYFKNRLSKWKKELSYLAEIHIICKDTNRLKIKEWKKIFHGNTNSKKSRVALLISLKAESEQRNFSGIKRGITYDKEVNSLINHNNH